MATKSVDDLLSEELWLASDERQNKDALFEHFNLTVVELMGLRAGAHLDFRDRWGQWARGVVKRRWSTKITIHFMGYADKYDETCDYTSKSFSATRFARYRTLSLLPATRLTDLEVGMLADVNPKGFHGWTVGEINRTHRQSGQVRVIYWQDGKKYVWWTHLNCCSEIAALGTYTRPEDVPRQATGVAKKFDAESDNPFEVLAPSPTVSDANLLKEHYLDSFELQKLKISDKIDFRDSFGKFYSGEVTDRYETSLKIHFLEWDKRWDEWCDYSANKRSAARFAHFHSVTRLPFREEDERKYKIGCLVDLYPRNVYPNLGWVSGQIRQIDSKSGQVRVAFLYRGSKKFSLYWTHVRNCDEINEFGTKTGICSEKPKELLCGVCGLKDKTHAMIPCGHKCACGDCALYLFGPKGRNCPVCERTVTRAVRVIE